MDDSAGLVTEEKRPFVDHIAKCDLDLACVNDLRTRHNDERQKRETKCAKQRQFVDASDFRCRIFIRWSRHRYAPNDGSCFAYAPSGCMPLNPAALACPLVSAGSIFTDWPIFPCAA